MIILTLSLTALTAAAESLMPAMLCYGCFSDSYAKYYKEHIDKPKPPAQIILDIEEGRKTYSFWIDTAGLYALEVDYVSLGADLSDTIEVGVFLNGKVPFEDARTLKLPRRRIEREMLTDEYGNQTLTRSVPYTGHMAAPFKDGSRLIYFYLTTGEHELTFLCEDKSAVFYSFTFKNYAEPPFYYEIKPDYMLIESTPALESINEVGSNTMFLQAEKPLHKTHADITATRDSVSYDVIPSGTSRRLYNTLGGGGTWSVPGQAVSWGFKIPNDGYYRFSMKARQNVQNSASYRRLLINGVVPCAEMNAIEFRHSPDWYRQDLRDAENNDIYIFLSAGIYELTLEAVCAGYNCTAFSPLELDYIEIATTHESFNRVNHDLYDQLIFSFGQFMNSYFNNDELSANHSKNNLNVWLPPETDRETALVVKAFIEREYNATVSLAPGAVLEAALAGNKPDVALFLSEEELLQLKKRGLLSMDTAEAREFLEWFNSDEVQERLRAELFAVKGASGIE